MAQPNILDYQKFSAELQKNQAENMAKRPGQNAHLAASLDQFTGQLRESGKGRRKNSWEYGMDGLVSGFSAGLKKSDSDASQKVMDYFNANTENIEAQNRFNTEKEQERIKMEPYAMTSLQLMNGDLPYEQVNQQLGSIWQQAQLANPKLKGSFVSYIPNSDMINVRGDDGKVSVVPMASFVGVDVYRDIRKDSLERQKFKVENDPKSIANKHKQAYIDDVNNRWNPNAQYDRNQAVEQAKKDAAFVQEQKERVLILDNAETKLLTLKDLFESDKPISGKTLGSTARRLLGEQFNTEGMGDTELMKAISNGLYSFMKDGNTFGNVNLKEFELQTKQSPDEMNTPKGNLKIINYQLKRLDDERKKSKDNINSFTDRNTKKPQKQPISPENSLTLTPEQQAAAGTNNMPARKDEVAQQSSEGEQMVPVIDPDGVPGKMPMSKLKGALNDGYSLQ